MTDTAEPVWIIVYGGDERPVYVVHEGGEKLLCNSHDEVERLRSEVHTLSTTCGHCGDLERAWAEAERLRSERDAARSAAVRADIVCDRQHDEIQRLRTALREARQGLEYWGPITGHGFGEKERITAIVDAALGLSTSD